MVDLSTLAAEPYPGISLVVGGTIAVLVAVIGRRDDSFLDEAGTVVAFILGIAVAIVCAIVVIENTLELFSKAILALLAMCLFMKPLRGIPWSVIFGLAAGTAAAYVASALLPPEVLGVEEWKLVLLVFFVVGGIVWLMTRIVEGLLSVSSTVVSWRPSIIVIGAVAIAEGASLLIEGASLASLL